MNDAMKKYLDSKFTDYFHEKLDVAFHRAVQRNPVLKEILDEENFFINIPAENHNPSDDQPLMLRINQKIFKQWGVNHVGITETVDYGKHTRIDLKNFEEEQNASDGFGLLYMLKNQLVFKDKDNKPIPLGGEGSIGTSGYVRFPIGDQKLTLQWGKGAGGNGSEVKFPVKFEGIPTCYVVIRRQSGVRNIWIIDGSETIENFKVGTDANLTAFNWWAIGK